MNIDDVTRGTLAILAFALALRAWHLRRIAVGPGRRISLIVQIVPLIGYGIFWALTVGFAGDPTRMTWLAWLSRFVYLGVLAVFWIQQQAIRDVQRAEASNGVHIIHGAPTST